VKAVAFFREALATFAKTRGPDHPETATVQCSLAEMLRAAGEYKEAETLFSSALAAFQKTFGSVDVHTAAPFEGLAATRIDQGDLAAGEDLARKALTIRESREGAESRREPGAATDLFISPDGALNLALRSPH